MMLAFRANKYEYRYVVIALVLLVTLGLRIYDLNARSLWFDEGMEYWVATSSVQDMPQSVRDGIQDPPLYSFLLHFWMKLGQSEFHLRFLSVMFSFMSVVGTILLGYKWSGLPTGLVAGVVMAILPSQIRYAQEVGQYALMGCLLTWCLISLQSLSKESSRRKYFVWIALAIATTYSYYGTVIAILMPFCVFLAEGLISRNWQSSKERAFALLFYVVGVTPLVLYFLPSQLFRGPTAEAFKITLNSPVEELRTFWISTQQLIAFQFTGWPWTYIPLWLSPFLVMLLLLSSIRIARTRKYLLLWLLSAWVVYYITSKLGLFPYGYRYGLILAPLLIPVISQGLISTFAVKKYQWILGVLVFLCIITICVISFPNRTLRVNLYPGADWAWPETQDLQPVIKYWLRNRNEADPTYVYYGAAPVFPYYLNLFGQDNTDLPPTWYVHCWQGKSPDYCHTNNIYYGEWVRQRTQAEKISSIRSALPLNPETMWLVFSHIYPEEDTVILAGLVEDYHIVLSYEQCNASVYLLEAK